MASPKMSLKLLLDKKGQRVLFAEANKEFVYILFHVFSLPLRTLIELLGSKQMVGCLGKLKDSIDSFNETYLQPGLKKDDIFNPKTPFSGNSFLLGNEVPTTGLGGAPKKIYRCSSASNHCYTRCKKANCFVNAALYAGTICPNCKGSMDIKMTRIMHKKEKRKIKANAMKKKKGGYVQEVITYIVMDNLVVKPMSGISSITLIRKFGVKDLSQLEEMVSFGKVEGLKLLKSSLMTEKVLTSIYMH